MHFKVYDEDALSGDDFMAQCVVPFHALRQGYRHVELRSKSDARLPNVTLFIHVAVLPGGSTYRPPSASLLTYGRRPIFA